MDLILASQSPRRKALLEQFGLTFRIQALPVQEKASGDPLETARANAVAKAKPVSVQNPAALVLGADTIVVLDGRILGKPKMPPKQKKCSVPSAAASLVTTVVALLVGGQSRVFSETTEVQFRRLSAAETPVI